MNEANKHFPALSPTVAQDRLDHVTWCMDTLDMTWDECAQLSLKEMKRMKAKHEHDQDD